MFSHRNRTGGICPTRAEHRALLERRLKDGRRGLRRVAAAVAAMDLVQRGRRNLLDIRETFHDWSFEAIPAEFSGTRILHLSDLHLDIDEGIGGRVAERVAALDYDFSVVTGDFQDAMSGGSEAVVKKGIGELRGALKGDVFFVLGNHDSMAVGEWARREGMVDLCNASVEITRRGTSLFMGGVDDAHYYKTHDLSFMPGGDTGRFSILLSHSPGIAEEAEEAGFDFMLSGHTHGGQICLPGGIPLSTGGVDRKYCSGRWRVGRLQGFTSRGLGGSLLPMRYNCPPELAVHRLLRK